MGSESSSKTQSSQTTNTIDERIAGADQAVAVRGGGDKSTTEVNYSIQTVDTDLLRDLASGAANLTANLLKSNQDITGDALAKVSDVKTTALSDSSASLQKTVLLGLVLGLAAIAALFMMRK